MARTTRKRVKRRDTSRRAKKKISVLTSENIEYVDWKDYTLLRKFMSERAKIRARRVTGNSTQQQKLVADAIKLAREMALVPYANRVTTQRQQKDRQSYRRANGPAPRPATPPPVQNAGSKDASDSAGKSKGAARARDRKSTRTPGATPRRAARSAS